MKYLMIIITLLTVFGCVEPQPDPPKQDVAVTDYDSCVAAGNPVMESYPRQCAHEGTTYRETGTDVDCVVAMGTWLKDSQECEGISQDDCEAMGGTFNGCASACRNNPDAEICTMQCVQVCQFSEDVEFESITVANDDMPDDGYALDDISLSGSILTLTISHSGGCEDHEYALVWNGAMTRSLPPQVNLWFSHEDNDDMCEAYLTVTKRYDLSGSFTQETAITFTDSQGTAHKFLYKPGDDNSMKIKDFESCTAAGFPIMESMPRQCTDGEGNTYTEEMKTGGDEDEHGCIPSAGYQWCEEKQKCLRAWEESCESLSLQVECETAGGKWNECGSRCQSENQGATDPVACPAVCEQLCECGGIAGFGCPEGYECKTPQGIADALGFCDKVMVAQGQ